MDIDARAFGQLEGEVKALRQMMADQNKALAVLHQQLEAVGKTLSEARGGWKTLVWLGGVSAAAASLVSWGVQHLRFGP